MFQDLNLRTDYFSEARAYAGLVDLLRDIFDIDISDQDRFTGPDPSAMPFGYFDRDGVCVANFSGFSMPLRILGRDVHAVGFQSGAVRPAFRGRGLYRDLMQRAFAWARAQGFELGLLLTDKAYLYRPYGFETVAQSCFSGPSLLGRAPANTVRQPVSRRLDLGAPADVALLIRLLERRQPVSEYFSLRRGLEMFLLNMAWNPSVTLTFLEADACVIAHFTEGDRAVIVDVVAEAMPSISTIAAAVNAGSGRIETRFFPDRLQWQAFTAERYHGSCDLMIANYSGMALPETGFALPMTADF